MSKGTIVRTILLVVALVNAVLEFKGMSPISIDEGAVDEIVSMAFLVGTTIASWWKNNSFTTAARVGDEAKEDYKKAEKAKKTLKARRTK